MSVGRTPWTYIIPSLPLGSSLPESCLQPKHETCVYIFWEFCFRMAKLELASNLILFQSGKKTQPPDICSFTYRISHFYLAKRQKPVCKRASNSLTWNVYSPLLLPFNLTPIHRHLTAAAQRHRIVVTHHLHVFICQNLDGCNIYFFSGPIFKNI